MHFIALSHRVVTCLQNKAGGNSMLAYKHRN